MEVDRKAWGFERIANEQFHFLVEDYGLKRVESDDFHLRFESRPLMILVSHAHIDRVLAVEVEDRRLRAKYSIETIEEALPVHPRIRPNGTMAWTPELVDRFLREYAVRLTHVMSALVDKDRDLFERLRVHNARSFELGKAAKHRARGNRAWLAGDFRSAIAAYDAVHPEMLLPSETAKLAYARKHLAER